MNTTWSRRIVAGTWVALMALLALPARAETKVAETAEPRMGDARPVGPELKRSDRRFIQKAIVCGSHEGAISRQASTNALHADVRAYAATVVGVQELITGELATLAKRRGAPISTDVPHADELADLAKKTGADYDKAYLEDIVDLHEDVIDLLEGASKSADTDVAAFAVQYLSVMRDHLARARQLEKAIQ